MIKIFKCRRSSLALIGMLLLAFIGYTKGIDVSFAIAGLGAGVAASNAYEKKGAKND